MSALPTEPGWYWAKWKIAEEGTVEGDELTPSKEWECVQVFENCIDHNVSNWLMVSVCGVDKAQSVENFFWGARIQQP